MMSAGNEIFKIVNIIFLMQMSITWNCNQNRKNFEMTSSGSGYIRNEENEIVKWQS